MIQKIGLAREGKNFSKSARKIGVTKEKSRAKYWSKTIKCFPGMNPSRTMSDIKTFSLEVRFKIKV